MVYSVMPNHPLDLQPGDIILGYDGIPWSRLLNDLFNSDLPMLSSDAYGVNIGASTAAFNHNAMISAGMNWGLFDTIDILKYPSNDTLHYPTSLLAAITQPYFIATEQLPVAGVPFPDIHQKKMVSWGIVEKTNIGYIYAWDWGAYGPDTGALFEQAVDELMHVHQVNGLILDCRSNHGGGSDNANEGFKHLFNMDPTVYYYTATRIKGNDHLAFTIDSSPHWDSFTPTSELFDRPIAVLLGPNCGSGGDYNAYRLRFHPMARSFGKPTSGAYVDISGSQMSNSPYKYSFQTSCLYSNFNNEGYLIHKSIPVDEEVWLTQEGVVKGEDDVVKRALEWINNLSYAHTVTLNKIVINPYIDTLTISAVVENPNGHSINVSATLTDDSNVILDSFELYDDGLHGDGQAGDKLWATSYFFNSSFEKTVHVTISTKDAAAGETRHLPSVVQCTSIGPLVYDGIKFVSSDQVVNPGDKLKMKFKLRNNGTSATAINVSYNVSSLDTCASIIGVTNSAFGNITVGTSVEAKSALTILFNKNCSGRTARFALEIMSNNYHFWNDTVAIEIFPTGIHDREAIVKEFHLEQNYPNPFNPTTTINYVLAKASHVRLTVYNTLGQVVAVLVDSRQARGSYQVKWDAQDQPSGIYLYRLDAGGSSTVKKMFLQK